MVKEKESVTLRTSQIYNTSRFDESESKRLKSALASYKKKVGKKVRDLSFYKKLVTARIPILNWLPNYKFKEYILQDIVAGVTVGVMNIPQGMGYSLLASMPAVHGLYIAFFPCIFYAFFGTSPHLAIGAIALTSLLSGTAITTMTSAYEMRHNFTSFNQTVLDEFRTDVDKYRVSVAISLTLLVGIIQMALGASGLGILTTYFSDTFVSSYTCGSAVHVIKSQLKDLLGISNSIRYTGLFNIPKSIVDLAIKLPEANWRTVVLSLVSMIYLVIFKEYLNPIIKKKTKVQFPSELLLVVVATTVSYFVGFNNYSIAVVGKVPNGFPIPQIPTTSLWPDLLPEAFIIALIAFSINISLACLFARKHNYAIESTQELYAYGLANIFSSFFQCFPSAASLSRSSILESSGGKTMLSAFFNSIVLLLVILFMGPLFKQLPKACLAAIIVVAFKNLLFQIKDVVTLWRINKFESITWVITFISVVFLNVDYGLVIGLAVSNFMIIVKDQFFQIRALEAYGESNDFVDKEFVVEIKKRHILVDVNVKIFKIQRSIYFANTEYLQKTLFKMYGYSPNSKAQVNKEFELKVVEEPATGSEEPSSDVSFTTVVARPDPDLILDMSAVNYVDTNGVKCIQQIIEDFKKINVTVYLCESQDNLIKTMYHMDVLKKLDQNFYVSIKDALTTISNQRQARLKKPIERIQIC